MQTRRVAGFKQHSRITAGRKKRIPARHCDAFDRQQAGHSFRHVEAHLTAIPRDQRAERTPHGEPLHHRQPLVFRHPDQFVKCRHRRHEQRVLVHRDCRRQRVHGHLFPGWQLAGPVDRPHRHALNVRHFHRATVLGSRQDQLAVERQILGDRPTAGKHREAVLKRRPGQELPQLPRGFRLPGEMPEPTGSGQVVVRQALVVRLTDFGKLHLASRLRRCRIQLEGKRPEFAARYQ